MSDLVFITHAHCGHSFEVASSDVAEKKPCVVCGEPLDVVDVINGVPAEVADASDEGKDGDEPGILDGLIAGVREILNT